MKRIMSYAAIVALPLATVAGPAQAARLSCHGLDQVWTISAPGVIGCAGTGRSWTKGSQTLVRVTFRVKDSRRDGHCAYLHEHVRHEEYGRAIAKTCGVGTTSSGTYIYAVPAYGVQLISIRGHRGYGAWSMTSVISVTGIH